MRGRKGKERERTKGEEGEEAAGTLKNGLKAGGKGVGACTGRGRLPGGQMEQSGWLEDLGGAGATQLGNNIQTPLSFVCKHIQVHYFI